MKNSKLPNVGITIFTTMSALADEYKAINLSQGFPDYPIDPELHQLVCTAMAQEKNQYAPLRGVGELLEAIADKIYSSYGCSLDPLRNICITAGATEGLFSAIQGLVHPGEEVIIFEPAYDSYIPSITLAGGIAVPVRLKAPYYNIDWEEVSGMINDKTAMIIINNPHNPTGTILSSADVSAIAELAERHDLVVLSDEVYEHIIFDGYIHESVLRYESLRNRSLAVFSFGKTFHVTGWRMGYIVGAPELMDEFMKVHQFNTFSINRPVQHALAEYLKVSDRYTSLGRFFQERRDFLANILDRTPLRRINSQGSYFMLAAYGHISDISDLDMAVKLTKEYGVATIPLSYFYSDLTDEHILRFCFAKQKGTLEDAGKRIMRL